MNMTKRRAVERQLDEAATACAKHGAQFTELRRSVLTLILEADAPLTAYQLLDRLKENRKGAVPPTIYRALDFLTEQGLIHKVKCLNAFIPCTDSEHDHHAVQFLICQKCGTVSEIEDHAISQALERAAEKQGFHPNHAIVELDGTCAACSAPS
jgi:Fur family transcriptional regulator, zinc uptake regulator